MREGQYVEPAAALFNISTLKQVWVSAEVFERQAAQLKVGDPVTMTLDYAPATGRAGSITSTRPWMPPPAPSRCGCALPTRTSS